jgi:protein involved in ribonucleotide reduction
VAGFVFHVSGGGTVFRDADVSGRAVGVLAAGRTKFGAAFGVSADASSSAKLARL